MDGLCLNTGIHGMSPSISINGGIGDARQSASRVSAVGREKQTVTAAANSRFSFRYPLRSLWPGGRETLSKHNGIAIDDAVIMDTGEDVTAVNGEAEAEGSSEGEKRNWVLNILLARSLNGGKDEKLEEDVVAMTEENHSGDAVAEEEVRECEFDGCRVDDDVNEIEFDRNSFSRLLKKVSLAEARLFAKMSYLGNLAYCIPHMKSENLLQRRGLHYVTSSVDKREMTVEKKQASGGDQEAEERNLKEEEESKEENNNGYSVSASTAYQIAASAASYLHSHTKNILPFKSLDLDLGKESSEGGSVSDENVDVMASDMASLMATTDSVTSVVAAKEEVKQAVADDLSSTSSSSCEWFICDDDQSTRYLVIQGSESLESWKANLLFEPVQFEDFDVIVHRGIYEAAKGMYEQILPEVHAHLKSHGRHATFRFTGHSLGGSLSLLINLMLLIRGEVPASSLLPVITFGAPSVMCGGNNLLRKLGLPRCHVQSITMHRDIVPRAFSCNYPTHVVELLKAVNRNFRNHPCLNNQKLLYAPMGELLILQPDKNFSPHHDLLPSGSGFYFLNVPVSETIDPEKHLRAAQTVFLNSPHPLEILSEHSAYGNGGTIQRDHDMNSYLKSVRSVIKQELMRIRKTKREHRLEYWWSLLSSGSISGGTLMGKPKTSVQMGQNQFNISGLLRTGRESIKQVSRLLVLQRLHLFVVLLFPARILLLGACSAINLR